jgi:hypothetical protein
VKSQKTNKKATSTTMVQIMVKALVDKKQIKARVQNGEDLKRVAKDYGLEVVMPL